MAKAAPRRRLLPAWMRTAGDDGPAVAPATAAERRKTATRPRAVAVHCMNEAELVDAALAVLAEKLQREKEEEAWSRSEEEQELQPTPGEAAGSTASTGGGSDGSPALPSPPDAGADAERTGWENSRDDVLKYVREIFFS